MGAGHSHGRRRAWGEPRPGLIGGVLARAREALGGGPTHSREGLPELPLALRRGDLATTYLAAAGSGDHAASAEAAVSAMEHAIAEEDWWPADLWAHRALWHYERAQLSLEAARQARRIGDLRAAAGDPESSRRYYAEAIDEARDIGAEHEQGLAAFGLGRALLELGQVTSARKLGAAAVDLLARADAPARDLEAARELQGSEVAVGEGSEESG